MYKRVGLFFLMVCVLVPFGFGQRIKLKKPPAEILKLPDIVVEKIKVSKLPWNERGKIMIRIDYTLYNNSSKNTKCCPTTAGLNGWEASPASNWLFNIRVEAKSDPNGMYKKLSNGGSVSTMMAPYERADFHATEVIPVTASKTYRVLADFGNWIREKNEDNNSRKAHWPVRVKIQKRKQ